MKKLLAVVGVVALVASIFIVALVSVVAVKGRGLDSESRLYADQTIVAIVSDWNERALLDQASPEFTRACPATCIDALFVQVGKLGALKRYLGSKGQANMNYLIGKGTSVTATYIARAAYGQYHKAIKTRRWRPLVSARTSPSQGERAEGAVNLDQGRHLPANRGGGLRYRDS